MNFTSLDEAWERPIQSRRFSVSSRPESAMSGNGSRSRSVSPSIESFFSDTTDFDVGSMDVETRGGNSSSRHKRRSHSPADSDSGSSSGGTIVVGAGSELGNERMIVSPPGATIENVFRDQEVQLTPLTNNYQAYQAQIQAKNKRIQEGYQGDIPDIGLDVDIAGNSMNSMSSNIGTSKDKTFIQKILQIENKLDEAIGGGNVRQSQSNFMNTMLEAGLLIGVGLFILVVMEMMLRMGRQHITYKFKIVD
jgi:hypothetical protein